MSGFIYLWYDRYHKMYYIGSHWGDKDDGYVCSSPWMLRAIKRRPNDFKRRIIDWVRTNREDLIDRENDWLQLTKVSEIKPNTTSPRYYNLNRNAWKLWHTVEASRKIVGERISLTKTGKVLGPYSEEHRKAISEGKREAFEKRRAETGQSYSEETLKSWEGRTYGPQSDESNEKRSKSLKLAYAEGRKKANTRPKTDEEKAHLSKTMKGRPGKPHAETTRDKLSKEWIVTSPSGEEHLVRNLKKFCQENGLQNTNVYKPSGSRGWYARHAPSPEPVT